MCNNDDLYYYSLYKNRLNYCMPPPFIIAPCLSPYPFYSTYDNNNNYYTDNNHNNFPSATIATAGIITKNEEPAADRGNAFSVAGQINADSGSSGTYVSIRDSSALFDVRATTQSSRIDVTVANGETIFSSHTGSLKLPSGHLLRAHIFSEFNTSLLSISDLVDIGYEITYSKQKVDFKIGEAVIFEGQRDLRTGLWMVNFSVF